MLVYRVFPYQSQAGADQPGHPLYLDPTQGRGRWDNPDRYGALYLAASASGAIGETFAHLSTWSRAMLPFPSIEDSQRVLGFYSLDEEVHPLLNLDDPRALLDRGLRPTEVVIRNRPRTQEIARQVFDEGKWSGLSWWSMHRPQWTLHALWRLDAIVCEGIEMLPGHPALRDAAQLLAKQLDTDVQ